LIGDGGRNMKKLLSLLGAVGLIATSSATVVSCGDPDKGTANNGGNDDNNPDGVKNLEYFYNITKNSDGVYDLGFLTLTNTEKDGNYFEEIPPLLAPYDIMKVIEYKLNTFATDANVLMQQIMNDVMDDKLIKIDMNLYMTDTNKLTVEAGHDVTFDFVIHYDSKAKEQDENILKEDDYHFIFTIKNMADIKTKQRSKVAYQNLE
jgi:hypothetical protein